MQMKIKYPAALVVLASTLGAFPAYADDALNLFNRMRDAVHSLSYAGSLVYVQGNEMSTYQIKHTIEEGAEKESVVRLTQENNNKTTEEINSFSLSKLQQVQPRKEQVYTFDLGGEERVANRTCQIVVARPKDRLRYLQRYCIDAETGMLLKYSLTDRNHQIVEQFMFTNLDLLASATESTNPKASSPAAAIAPAGKSEKSTALADLKPPADAKEMSDWSFKNLPDGFQQVNSLWQESGDRQIILSDGMTSVSVFIAKPGNTEDVQTLEYSSGAMNIFTRQLDGYKVTLVGEVPVGTLRNISEGITRAR